MLRQLTLAVALCWVHLDAQAQEPQAVGMGFTLVGPSFAAIQVRNEAAAADWYTAALGLEEVNRLEAPDGRYSIRILSGNVLSAELIHRASASTPTEPPLGLFKAGIYVDDIDAAFAWLDERGVDTNERVLTDRALRARFFTFRDLEGNRWQVFERCEANCGP